MKKLLQFLDNHLLKILVASLLLFIPLYPKLPSIHVNGTWVYIRLEDFLILFTFFVWVIEVLRRKVILPFPMGYPIVLYWGVGFLSFLFSLLILAPEIINYYPHIAFLNFARRIEYMVLFFIAASTIKSIKDLKQYLIVLSTAVIGIVLYGIGQRYYIYLWNMFPEFFKKYSFCFPSFQTGNEEFAKGIPFCLPPEARITSTFAGHYDLGAYLVIVIPIFIALFFTIKRLYLKIGVFLLFFFSLILLMLTASRISFLAYLFGMTFLFFFLKKKKFIPLFFLISIGLLLLFSGSTAKRFLDTIRITSIVTDNQGRIVGQSIDTLPDDLRIKIANKSQIINAPPPSQNLPVGTVFTPLPGSRPTASTTSAVIKTQISEDEAKRLKLQYGGIEISTVSGTFLVQKALVYDISFTTRFQAEWPNAWNAFMRSPLLGSGYSSITLASDNDYIRALGETGILGIGTFIFIFIVFGITLKASIGSIKESLPRAYLIGLAAGSIGLFANATLIDVFEASKVAENYWIFLGIGAGIILYYQKEKIAYKKRLLTLFTTHLFICLYILCIGLTVFLPSINTFFTADDFTWLRWAASSSIPDVQNYFIDSTDFFYRPIPKTVMFFLYTFLSFQPQGYHVFILSLHILASFAIYILGLQILHKKSLAFFAALLFLLMPAHGEIVFWLATLSTTISTVFILFGLIFYINWRQSNFLLSYVGAFFFFVLSLLSYEMSIIFPLLCVLIDVFIIKQKVTMRSILFYIPFFVLLPLYYQLRIVVNSVQLGGDYSYNLVKIIPNMVGNYIGYLGFYIFGQSAIPYYTIARNELRDNFLLITVLLLLIGMGVCFIILYQREKIKNLYKNSQVQLIIFSLLFAFISLLTVLGLGNITERYGYLSSVGYVFLLVIIMYSVLTKVLKKEKKVFIGLFLIVTLLSGIYINQLAIQKRDWENAGNITKNALTIFRVYYTPIPSYSNVYIVNMPIKKAQAWIFPVGFNDGLWFIYRDPTIKIIKVQSVEEAKDLRSQAQATTLVKNYIFLFDKEGRINEVK